ncbi:MAG: CDC48 family AAA ATPase [Chloroflexi bacterium]|nr:CDC48 family AAA ATPase [Chloroflexota bacterium]
MKEQAGILTLKVSEALPRDVGRGFARLDPCDMEKVDAEVGNIVEISGKRKTYARLMPTHMEDRGKGLIKIDGITRENAQVSMDEKVEISKADSRAASQVILAPLTSAAAFKESDTKYIGKLIEGLTLVSGDRVRIALFGSGFRDFSVVETHPKDVVLIHSNTKITIKSDKLPAGKGVKFSYEDIGGLGKEIQRIREMIELPLKYPEVFERLGIDAPKGVLLHGPPGCGKTLIARVVANETDAHFVHLSGPEIMHKFYGESEANLRKVFEEAQANAPSIIFMDEIDAIAPKREELGGEKQVERRVVAQLLALMDGLQERGHVIIIGATNIPQVLDPALRRPGRFDREIEISVPDKNGRMEILQIHTRGMPLSEDVNLEKLAEMTHGYVGADLEALCREAAMSALRELLPKIDFEANYIPYELLLELQVGMNNFLKAFAEVEPSALREFFTEVPDVTWEDIGGLEEVKKLLTETIDWPMNHPEIFECAKTRPPKGIILYGKPGTGKTLLAKAAARESGVNFIAIKGPALISKYMGESERAVREIFKKARQASPCILFFDEIDSITPTRGGWETSGHTTERVISQFLSEMDGIEDLKGVVVLGATNRIDIIDSALLRAGRFEHLIELPSPDKGARYEIFKVHTRGKPLADDVVLEKLASQTEGVVGADIESICRKAALAAIREFLEKKETDLSQLKISLKHFKEVMK